MGPNVYPPETGEPITRFWNSCPCRKPRKVNLIFFETKFFSLSFSIFSLFFSATKVE